MNLDNFRTVIDTPKLLQAFSEEQIMEFYFGEPVKLKHPYLNPFRKDNFPKCYFFYTKMGQLVFNDFSAGKQYNCFTIANLRCGEKLTAQQIYNQMSNLHVLDVPKPTIKYDPDDNESATTIKVEVMPYDKKDLVYWEQFNITLETLKRFNVRKVRKAWINGELRYLYSDKDPCYRYLEVDKIKLYRPFNKKVKFRNNYSLQLECTSMLPERGNKLIITKATKDVMVFSTLGINAVCPTTEASRLTQETLDDLCTRFKKVYVWYDSDEPGEQLSTNLCSRDRRLIRISHNNMLGKDTSDIVKNHGIKKLIELCKQYEIL